MAVSGPRMCLQLLRRSQKKQLLAGSCQLAACFMDQSGHSRDYNVMERLVQTAAQPKMERDESDAPVDRLKKATRSRTDLSSRAKELPVRAIKARLREDTPLSPLETYVEHKPPTLDRLILEGLLFHGFHGVFEEERRLGQKFLVDVDAWLDLHPAGESDRLEDSVSYADIYRLIKGIMEGEPHLLLESVAQHIARDILSQYAAIHEVRVKVRKPHVAVLGVVDALGVEIRRNRRHFANK